ncbi:MAG: hypothetical protein HKN03_06890 [Acidimicrobiales bacterium]|nr:hypothetical protein [Acidimicrobiales bacterium]
MTTTAFPIHVSPAQPGGPDLVAEIFTQPGPCASIYIPAESDRTGAIERHSLHASNAGRSIVDHGWSQQAAENVRSALVGLGPHGGATSVVIASPERVLLTGHLADPYKARVTVEELPDLAPVLDSASRTIPHVVVLADRSGADVFSVSAPGASATTTVHGDTEYIHRGHPGGWSQRRFQQRAENTWEHNASEVADEVRDAVKEIGAQLIVAAGDVRAIGFLRHALGSTADLLVEVEGSRHTDADVIAPRVTDVVASAVAERRAKRLAHLRDAIAGGLGSSSTQDVLRALRRGAVDTLYIAPVPPGENTAFFSRTDPMLVALKASELHDLAPADSVGSGSFISAALRSALAQRSHIEMVPNAAVLGENHCAATFRFDINTDT